MDGGEVRPPVILGAPWGPFPANLVVRCLMETACKHPSTQPVWFESMGEKRMRCDRCEELLSVAHVRALRGGRPLNIGEWQSMFLDYVEGVTTQLPSIKLLDEDERDRALGRVRSYEAARGINPYAVRPTLDDLLTAPIPSSA